MKPELEALFKKVTDQVSPSVRPVVAGWLWQIWKAGQDSKLPEKETEVEKYRGSRL
ncbi:hypothetical protein [Adhaeribacter arboris]|uniref:hypothetical protein n=1 Tax=Adhaeribacter arboris TaxID=2072846 RepID=UPI001304E39F|nr:hypothetical protein [Adhaeribacter arboris]